MLAYGFFRHVSEFRPGIPEIPAGQRFQAMTVKACLNLLTAAGRLPQTGRRAGQRSPPKPCPLPKSG
jgi:hypothetical protein